MQNIDDTITIEVKSRLNDLFGQTEDESVGSVNGLRQDASPLKDLKSAVLSLDWEISEEVMRDFIQQVDLLKTTLSNDRIALLFLQLLGSVGKYIQAYKGRSHPQAFKILNTVFNRLEEVVTYPDLKETDKKRFLYAEIIKFKDLREKIGLERTVSPAGNGANAGPKKKPALHPSRMATPSAAPEKKRRVDAKSVSDPAASKDAPKMTKDAIAAPVFHEVSEKQARSRRINRPPAPAAEKEQAVAGRQGVAEFTSVFLEKQADAEVGAGSRAGIQTPENILAAIEELKALLQEEFSSLRTQLRLLGRYR